jgi:rSAM/selenodomain-associated transferase 1
MEGALVIRAAAPTPGQVKTGLRPHLTASQSAALYRRFLADLFESTQDVEGMDFFLAYTPRGERDAFDSLVPPPFQVFSPRGTDQGQRLSDIFSRLMGRGYRRVMVLNSDNPDLPTCLIHQAAEVLEGARVEMVLGPNERGGYYLIGLNRLYPDLFKEIDWNSSKVTRQTLRRARKLGVRFCRLPEWYDIETVEDLRRHLTYYRLRKSGPPGRTSQTYRYLHGIRKRIAM